MARVIAVANQKGGVGKTTTTINLGGAIARKQRRVLLIDLDPQECLAAALKLETLGVDRSMSQVLCNSLPMQDILIERGGLWIAPAGPDLAEAEVKLFMEVGGASVLSEALEPLLERFDYILCDCPPSLGLLTLSGLAAADEVLVPAQAEFLAVRRIGAIMRTIEKVQKRLNAGLTVLGILPTMYDARTIHMRDALAQIQSAYGAQCRVFEPISRSVRFAEATVAGESILDYDATFAGAKLYEQMASELVQQERKQG